MYRHFYGFSEKPFSLLPDSEFLFPSRKHQLALNMLEMAICNQSGFCVISGETGIGKTTLVRALLNRLDENVCVGLISNTHDSYDELLGWVLAAFDLKPEHDEVVRQHRQFTDFLIRQYAAGRHTLLIIDEAQNLSLSAMEQLRMLSNVNSDKDLVLQVILVGQKELGSKLRDPELAQFAQRIAIDYHLAALDEQETTAYIRHRLVRAGGSAGLFDDAACKRVFHYSKGVPRLINRICDLSLVYGYADQANVIGAALIDAVVREQMKSAGDGTAASASGRKVLHTPLAIESDNNKNGAEQPGVKAMKESHEQVATRNPVSPGRAEESTRKTSDAAVTAPAVAAELPPLETLRAAAEKALEEKTRAEKLAAEKAAAARAAIEKATAELAVARAAASEKLAGEKLAAEKVIADRKAARQIAASKAAAESAVSARQEAEQAVVGCDEKASEAVKKIDSEKLASDNDVFDKINHEKTVMEEAAAATAAAEKTLAERIAAEKAAAEIAAVADAAVKKALMERVAAEKEAAARVAAAEQAAAQATTVQADVRRIAAEKLAAEKAALSKAEADAAAARQIAAERSAAKEAEQRLVAVAEQAAETAKATRTAAEKAVAEHMAASKLAAESITAEKVALAKVAARVAAAAKLAAEQAEAARIAAFREASEKEAAAVDAARKAVEAEAAAQEAVTTEKGADDVKAVAIPQPVETGKKPHPLDHLLLAGAHVNEENRAGRSGRKGGRTWAVMTIAAVAAGATLLAGKWTDVRSTGESRAVSHDSVTETASVAAMEVGKARRDAGQQP